MAVGEIKEEDHILFNETPSENSLYSPSLPEKISAANAKLENEGDSRRRPLPKGLVEIQASRACPAQLDPVLEQPGTLTYTLPTVGDRVDSRNGLVRVETLSFYRLDSVAGVWNKIPSRIEGNKLTATVKELGTLAVMGQEDVSLQDLRVSPNPFHQGTDAHITFANLAERATVRVFTSSGREVRSLEETDGDGLLQWDGKNSSGNSVEPGVYVYHVESPGAEKKGKVMVLR
ncbi:MAG: T9SS type A sorting domain-containing protein [Elusimicrobia bacterium]|nr:T9SS type A sorting domain-containing protein [Elusimicrobiota bacterium]